MIIKRQNIDHINLVSRNERAISSAKVVQRLLTDDSVEISVLANSPLDIKINDTFELFNSVYRVNSLPSVTKNNDNSYEYSISAQGLMFDMLRCKFFNVDGTGFKTTMDFPLIGDLGLFLEVIKNNMNRFSNKWKIGTFPSGTATKTITFGNDNCLSAIQKICQEYKTDFWVQAFNGDYYIHVGAFGNTLPITLEYGKGKGLYSLSRQNVNDNEVVSRLYVQGGSENLKPEYRNYSSNLKFSNEGYIEDAALISEIGLIEGSIEIPEIYPKRTGVISGVVSAVKFEDDEMDFDLNEKNLDGSTKYLIPGTSAKIHFNTGNLAGYEFEIKKNGYDHATKTFEIIPYKNDQGQIFPDASTAAFQFAPYDEYVILDIMMPQSYVDDAEAELLTKGTQQFNKYKTAKVSYSLSCDSEFIKNLQTPFGIGDYIQVKDDALGIDKVMRIIAITKNYINNGETTPFNWDVELADDYEIDYASQLILEVKDIRSVIAIHNLGQISYSNIGMKTTEELKNLIFDTEGYFDPENIKPFSIETNMLTVGAQNQQLSCSVVFSINHNGDANAVSSTLGQLYSQTMDKTWTIAAYTTTIPDNDWRYVYAKVSKTTTSGVIEYSQVKHTVEEDANNYYFLLGILHSIVDSVRVLSITYGTTTINGGLIRTGIISSLDGTTYFNLNTGEIQGSITFNVNSPAFLQIKNSIVVGARNYTLGTGEEKEGNASFIKYPLSPDMDSGDYIVSFDYTTASTNAIGIMIGALNPTVSYDYTGDLTAPSGHFSQPITFNRDITDTHWHLYVNSLTQISNLKVEKGTVATSWTPAPEDVQAGLDNMQVSIEDIEEKTDNFISINGGLLMGNILSVGDNELHQNAFISGVTDAGGNSIRFGAGADYANKNTAPFRVLDNGKMIAQNADISGKVVSQEGNIGGWNITPTSLNSQTGKLYFGTLTTQGTLANGIMIAEDTLGTFVKNRFVIHSDKNNVNNYGILVNTTGSGSNNNAVVASAWGGIENNAFFLDKGNFLFGYSSGTFKLFRSDNGQIAYGINATVAVTGGILRFEKGLLVSKT